MSFPSAPRAEAQPLAAGSEGQSETDRARAMVAAHEAELARGADKARSGRLHFECARLLEAVLGEHAPAAEHYAKAVALLPEHVPSVRGARRALLASRTQQQALPLFDAEVKLSPSERHKSVVLEEKGHVLARLPGSRKAAIATLAKAHQLDEARVSVLAELELALTSEEAWDELEKTLEKESNAVSADPRHRAALIAARARLVEVRRSDRAHAAELYQSALGLDPHAPGVVPALKTLTYTQQRWRDFVQVLEHEAKTTSAPVVRAQALQQITRVLVDRLGSLEDGIAALERATKETPEDAQLLEELARLYELAQKPEGLAGVLVRLAQLLQDDSGRVVLFSRIAQIHEEELGVEETAIAWYARALAADPTYLPALEALAKLYTHRKQWEPLIAILANEAERSPDLARRAANHARIAQLYERELGDSEQAIQHHARALGLVRGYEPSFKALSRLFESTQRHRELIELHERAVEEAVDVENKIAHLFRIGHYQENALKLAGHAVLTYERILAIEPQHLGAVLAMQRAAERAADWPKLVRALELEAQKSADKARVAALLHRAGEVTEEQLGDIDGALAYYRKVLTTAPRHSATLASLGRLYHKLGRWEDLLDNYRRELAGTPKGPASAALLCKMAEIARAKLGKPEEALKLYRDAVDAAPTHDVARRALERGLAESGLWSDLAKLLEQELGLRDAPGARARVAQRLAEVYEHRLAEAGKALQAYEQALKAVPEHRPSLDGRARLLALARSHARLADELEQEATRSPDPLLAVAALFRAAEIRRDDLNDAAAAQRCLDGVLGLDPQHTGALLASEPLLAKQGAWEKLAQVLRAEATVLTDPSARVAVLHRLARVLEQDLGQGPDEIRTILFAVLEVDGDDLAALFALERIALAQGDRRLLAQVDAKLARLIEEPLLAAAHMTRLGEYLESTGDARALDAFRTALAKDSESLSAAHGVARLAEKSNDPGALDEAAEILQRLLKERQLAATLLVSGARLRLEQKEHAAAAQSLSRALELDPDHELAAERLFELLRAQGQVDDLLERLSHAAQGATIRERRALLWQRVSVLHSEDKRDLPAAIAALQRVTAEQPGHVPALLELAKLYARDGQWANAAAGLDEALKRSPPPEVAREATLMLATILDEHIGESRRALVLVTKLLDEDPKHHAALERQLAIRLRIGEHEQAAGAAERLVELAAEPTERAQALCTLARVERARGRTAQALRAYEQAVEAVGLGGTAAQQLRDLLQVMKQEGHPPSWRGYVTALERFVATQPARASLTPIYAEIARVLAQELHQNDEALRYIDRGLELDASSPDLHAERGHRLERAGDLAGATDAYRRVLALDVTRADAWRDLAAALVGMQRKSDALLALAPLVAIGQATDAEAAQVAALPVRAGLAPPGSLTAEELEALDAVDSSDPTRAVLALLNEVLPRLYPPDLGRFGLTQRDRVAARSGHPIRTTSDRVAAIFGVADHQLYVQEVHAGGIEVELTDPLSVIVPAYFSTLPEAQQVFLLGRVFASMARRLHVIDRLPVAELEAFLVAGLRAVVPGAGNTVADEATVAELSRKIIKNLSRRGRRALEDAVPLHPQRLNVSDWVQRARMGSARAALVVADELPGCVTLHRRLEGDLGGLQGEALARGMRIAEDLLRFWVSEPAFKLRRRVGMI